MFIQINAGGKKSFQPINGKSSRMKSSLLLAYYKLFIGVRAKQMNYD